MPNNETPIEKKTWKEFRSTGLFWYVNSFLHLFGWVIVFEPDEKGEIGDVVYPARTSFRGFDEKSNSDGFIKVSGYLKENINELLQEAKS